MTHSKTDYASSLYMTQACTAEHRAHWSYETAVQGALCS